jgi:hypothetical protein
MDEMVAHANLTRKQQSVPLLAAVVDRRGVAGTLGILNV